MKDFDYKKLKDDLTDYYGAAAFSGLSAAIMDVSRMENASKEELLREATKNGLDLNKYTKNGW